MRYTPEINRTNIEKLRVVNELSYVKEDNIANPNEIVKGNLWIDQGYLHLKGIIDIPQGMDAQGHKVFKSVEKDELLTNITLLEGINYIYVDVDGNVGVTKTPPKFGGTPPEKGDWFDPIKNRWFNGGELIPDRNYLGYYVVATAGGNPVEVVKFDGAIVDDRTADTLQVILADLKRYVDELADLKAKIDELGEAMTLNDRVSSLETKIGELTCKIEAIVTEALGKDDVVTWDGKKFVPLEVKEVIPTLVNGTTPVSGLGDGDERLEFHIFGKYLASARGAIEMPTDNFVKSPYGDKWYSLVARISDADLRPAPGTMYKAHIGTVLDKKGNNVYNASLSVYDNGDIKVWVTDPNNSFNQRGTTFKLYLDGVTFAIQ